MINDNYKTIAISVSTRSRHLEGIAAATIIPGMICDLSSSGAINVDTYDAGGVDQKPCAVIVAVENIYDGGTIDTNYTAGDKIYLRHLVPGDVFHGIAAEAITKGEYLCGDGSGRLKGSTDPLKGNMLALESAVLGARVVVSVGY